MLNGSGTDALRNNPAFRGTGVYFENCCFRLAKTSWGLSGGLGGSSGRNLKFVSYTTVISRDLDQRVESTHTSSICLPNLWPLYSSFDVISDVCLAWKAGQRGRKGTFDVIVRISNVC